MLAEPPRALTEMPPRRRLMLALAGAAMPLRPARAAAPALPFALVDLPPWVTPDDRQDGGGILVELARQLESGSGQAFDTQALPYMRALAMLESGAAALMFAYDTPRLERAALNLGALGGDAIVLLAGRGACCEKRPDRPGRVVGHIRGAAYPVDVIADDSVIKYPLNNYEQGLHMLLGGRLDALVAPRTSLLYAMHEARLDAGRFGPATVLRQTTLSLHLSRRHADAPQRGALAQARARLRRGDALGALIGRYITGAR
jgi:ABC-type amino acid transport substrate-binding protein